MTVWERPLGTGYSSPTPSHDRWKKKIWSPTRAVWTRQGHGEVFVRGVGVNDRTVLFCSYPKRPYLRFIHGDFCVAWESVYATYFSDDSASTGPWVASRNQSLKSHFHFAGGDTTTQQRTGPGSWSHSVGLCRRHGVSTQAAHSQILKLDPGDGPWGLLWFAPQSWIPSRI